MHFLDSFLNLYLHSPLMFMSNDDVPNGHAIGTRVLLSVVLKHSSSSYMNSIEETSIEYIDCCLDGNPNKIFHVGPISFT